MRIYVHAIQYSAYLTGTSMAPEKKTKGRQRIEMKLIGDENARRITFTKRREGLFKKAMEVSALCGADIALVILSSGGNKAYSFGHPCVNSVASRFLTDGNDVEAEDSQSQDFVDDDDEDRLHGLREECNKMEEDLEIEKRRGRELEEGLDGSGWISGEYLSRLDLAQLQHLKEVFEKLRDDLRRDVNGSAESSNLAAEVEREGGGGAPEPIPRNWLKL